eukprot:TRINITY_DN37922_c0_g1_i1.p1 TRINITY_DN37922_c0_g1~~TRINITY_DN37922_c0_g1_i1.p1  ORF type:complete len:418 (+),score=97.65 TRINITY_DN37922_c0_g1_i1:95-1348(+)
MFFFFFKQKTAYEMLRSLVGSEMCIRDSLEERCPSQPGIADKVKADPSVLDGLTYPVSLVYMLRRAGYPLGELQRSGHALKVVVLGAAARCEERIARETRYWDEISQLTKTRVDLILTGPEVSCTESLACSADGRTSLQLFRGTLRDLIQQEGGMLPDQDRTVLVTYNGGFGNWVESQRHSLLCDWFPDLVAVANSNLPAFFTQANDYADLVGELAIFSSAIQTQFILAPGRNPFAAASHLAEPDNPESWACANSCYYAIQGGGSSLEFGEESGLCESSRQLLIALVQQRSQHVGEMDVTPVPISRPGEGEEAEAEAEELVGVGTRDEGHEVEGEGQQALVEVVASEDRVLVHVICPMIQRVGEIADIDLETDVLTVCFATGRPPMVVRLPAHGRDGLEVVAAKFDLADRKLTVTLQ